jgi:hypothetical protein
MDLANRIDIEFELRLRLAVLVPVTDPNRDEHTNDNLSTQSNFLSTILAQKEPKPMDFFDPLLPLI